MKTEKQQSVAAAAFAKKWEGRGYEKGESQIFWTELLTEVMGVEDPSQFIQFEQQALLDHTSFIDGMIPSTHVMIEQKSLGKDLRQAIRQSDGSLLTPFQQAQRYSAALPYSQRPRWIVTCNFAEFDVYDMENPKGEPSRILLKDLEKEYYRLQFLVDQQGVHLQREMEVSMKAGEIVGKLYDALVSQYDLDDPQSLRYLNILCVRLVFCLYAEDAGVFGKHDMFHDYLAQFGSSFMRMALVQLFEVLNTPADKRSKYLNPTLAAFPYTNRWPLRRGDRHSAVHRRASGYAPAARLARLRLERDLAYHLRWCVREHPQPRDPSIGRYALYVDREYPQGDRPALL